jgi:hypothetical protein
MKILQKIIGWGGGGGLKNVKIDPIGLCGVM